jgi:hypothetical protein
LVRQVEVAAYIMACCCGGWSGCGVHMGWVLKPSIVTAVLYYLGNFPDVFPTSFDLAALVFLAFSYWLRLMVQIDWW